MGLFFFSLFLLIRSQLEKRSCMQQKESKPPTTVSPANKAGLLGNGHIWAIQVHCVVLCIGVSREFRGKISPRTEPHRSGTLHVQFIKWGRYSRWIVISMIRFPLYDFYSLTVTYFTWVLAWVLALSPSPIWDQHHRPRGPGHAHPTAQHVQSWDAAPTLFAMVPLGTWTLTWYWMAVHRQSHKGHVALPI